MRRQRDFTSPNRRFSRDGLTRKRFAPDGDGSRLLRGWLPRLVAPALVVGLALTGVSAPAWADDGSSDQSGTPSAQQSPADTSAAPVDSSTPASDPAPDPAPTPSADPTPDPTPQPSSPPADDSSATQQVSAYSLPVTSTPSPSPSAHPNGKSGGEDKSGYGDKGTGTKGGKDTKPKAAPPCITVSKTSDPASGSVVAPGSIITYTLTATVTGTTPASLTLTDDLSGVLNNASLEGEPLASQGTAIVDGTSLEWTITDFTAPLTLTYSVHVNSGAFGVHLKNVLVVPPGAKCDGSCTTEHSTPCWTITKTADPASGSTVVPGQKIVYTITAINDSGVALSGATATDGLAQVLPAATLDSPLPAGLALGADGTSLDWTIPTIPAHGSVSVSFSVTVAAVASETLIINVAVPGPGGDCAPSSAGKTARCVTVHCVKVPPVQPKDVDLAIAKTHESADDGLVDSGKSELLEYTLTVTNPGDATATGVVVSDPLPAGLTFVAGSGSGPVGWTITSAGDQVTAAFTGSFAPGDTAVLTFQTIVGVLDRSGPSVPFPDVDNTACVTSDQTDVNTSDNCSTDITKVKSVAVTAQAVCLNDAPVVSYSLTPYNVTTAPTIAIIWWTADAYAHRDPTIAAGDQAALIADGASQIDYVTLPAGWVNGETISGTQLWPGAGVDASGRGDAWPGWRQLADGQWVLDPAAPFYDLRGGAVVEVRINPTTASTVAYPPPSTHCDPAVTTVTTTGTPTGTTTTASDTSTGLASTGSDVTWPLVGAGLLLAAGAALVLWMRRRRDEETE